MPLPGVLLPVLVLLFKDNEAAAAPITSCDSFVYTCLEVNTNGYVLMDSPYAISPEGPYSIYDCVYVYFLLCSFPRMFMNRWMNG
jgi:hypothetical protein